MCIYLLKYAPTTTLHPHRNRRCIHTTKIIILRNSLYISVIFLHIQFTATNSQQKCKNHPYFGCFGFTKVSKKKATSKGGIHFIQV